MGLDNYRLLQVPINVSAAGDNVILASTSPDRVFSIYRIFFVLGTTGANVTIKRGATSLTGPVPMTGYGAFMLDFTEEHWFATEPGEDFIINLSAATQCSGTVYYTERTP
jgi:hypothetical protein